MDKLSFSVFLIALLIASCSSMPPEATAALTATPPNTLTPSPTATLRPFPTPTEMRPELVKCEELEHTTTGALFNEGVIITYFGTMGENNQSISMTLAYSGPNVEGRFFYLDKYKNKSDETKVRGCLQKGRDFTLYVYNDGSVLAVIHGRFPESDPKGGWGDKLEGEVMIGIWEDKLATETSSIYLSYDHGNRGTLDHQYQMAGAKDDQIIDEAAQELLSAVAKEDKESVAQMMAYTIVAVIDGERKVVMNQDEFLLNYEKIFTKEFKSILADTRPHHLDAVWGGIMLGSGDIWLNADGMVFVINNYGG